MLKLKQAKHVQQSPNSIWLVLRNHENKLESKTNKTEIKKSLSTQNNTIYSSLNYIMQHIT